LGKGSFGKVCVCSHKQTGRAYALKYIKKRISHSDKVPRHALNERNVLEAIDHPCIANLKYSFQDSHYMYLLMDYFEAGDLRRHMTRLWEEDEIRVVAAELVSALDHIHGFGILHRDLKPENVLVDGNGHVFMSDFDLARTFTGRGINTMAGTEPYMAPEMFRGDYYTHSPDLWALGVILFEMVCGERPFRSKNRKEHILKGRYEIPRSIKLSKDCVNLIESLLQVKTVMRLGYPATEAVMDHPWFINVNWKRMNAGEEIPVYVP
ncbi:kinase-like domain-containing protein, partial [Gorgonomyces haynaldii]